MRRPLAMTASLLIVLAACGSAADTDPFALFTTQWRDDPIWNDGKAEYCLYDATRTIYGKPRHYQARLFTNKELADPVTKTKSADNRGRVAFKHHMRDDISTENYSYHYSTMCYVGVTDLKSLKLDMGAQEDCGTSFKQYVNHAGQCDWRQSTYFPKEGFRSGTYRPSRDFVFQDALSLVLRGFPFEDPPRSLALKMLADQTTNRWTVSSATPVTIRYLGRETLDLPVGTVEAYRLRVSTTGKGSTGAAISHEYWFSASGQPPWLHVMVQYTGPNGISYKLREHKRWAYWKRPPR